MSMQRYRRNDRGPWVPPIFDEAYAVGLQGRDMAKVRILFMPASPEFPTPGLFLYMDSPAGRARARVTITELQGLSLFLQGSANLMAEAYIQQTQKAAALRAENDAIENLGYDPKQLQQLLDAAKQVQNGGAPWPPLSPTSKEAPPSPAPTDSSPPDSNSPPHSVTTPS